MSEPVARQLKAGARTRTFWGDQVLLSLVEIDANSEVPSHTHPDEQAVMLVEGELEMGIGALGFEKVTTATAASDKIL
jgi:quercetin dioxygenase-like cupin family protein